MFELDFGAYELRREGRPLRLARIPMELLLLLVERHGQLVTRGEISEHVWGKNVFLDTDNSINAVIRRIRLVLEDDPEQPRFIQTVVGRGYRFIAPIEEDYCPIDFGGREPKSIENPHAESLSGDISRPLPPSRSRMRVWFACAVALVLAGILGLEFGAIRARLSAATGHAAAFNFPKKRPSVAVLGFKNLSGKADEAWISTALQEMYSSELAADEQMRVIPGEDVARMKLDLALPAADSYGRDTLGHIRGRLNADMVVLGSYFSAGSETDGKIRIDVQLQDTRTGETVAVISQNGRAADLTELISQSGINLRQKLGLGKASSRETSYARASLPTNSEGARFYAEGIEKLRSFDALAARDLLLKAIATDPDCALTHAALSDAWSSLGYDAKAQEEAKKAFDLSSNLPREEQLAVEGRYRVATHEWPRAVEIYRMLWEFFPDNLDYGLSLASVQTSAGLGKDVMATIEAMSRRSRGPESDPRIDLAEAFAANLVGDVRREEAAASRAVDKARRQGARMMAARALLTRASALSTLGDNAAAIPLLKEAQAVFAEVGDKRDVVRVLVNLGIIARRQDHLVAAQEFLEDALRLARDTGSKVGMQQVLVSLGNVYLDEGNLPRTRQAYEESLSLARETGDKDRQATLLNNIAGLLSMQGRLAEATRMSEDALTLFQEVGDRESIGMTLGNIAELDLRQGDLPAARKHAEDAVAIDRQVGDKSLEGWALYELASVLVAQGDLQAGARKHEEAAILRHTLGEKVTEAENQLELAQLQLDAGDAKGAESEARRVIAVFHDGSSTDDEALSYSLVAVALSAQGRVAEAQQASAKASELLPRVLDLVSRLKIEIDGSYVKGLAHVPIAAPIDTTETTVVFRELEAIREKANRFGYAELALEARWREGQLELQSGRRIAGRSRLEQVRRDAEAKGLLLMARKASGIPPTGISRLGVAAVHPGS